MTGEAQQRLVFGRDRDPGVAEELIERGGDRVKNGKGQLGAFKANPMIPLYGPGPEGAICRDCTHLVARRFSRTYYKCDLRRETASPVSDHRVRWPACAKFEARS